MPAAFSSADRLKSPIRLAARCAVRQPEVSWSLGWILRLAYRGSVTNEQQAVLRELVWVDRDQLGEP